jgi:hypothetical protein
MRLPCLVAALSLFAACGSTSMSGDAGTDAGPRPHLSGLPDCGTVTDGGTIDDFFDDVIVPKGCGASDCHGPSPYYLYVFTDAGELRSAWVNQPSAQAPGAKRITPFDVDQSYVLYKLWGQHMDAGYEGSGDRMPPGGPYVTDAEMCRLINWVNGGAR